MPRFPTIASASDDEIRLRAQAIVRSLRDAPPPRSKTGGVYVIGWAKAGPVKVGIADRNGNRLTQLQVGCPYKLLVFYSTRELRGRALDVEQTAHVELAAYRMVGEWFNVSAKMAIEVVKRLAARPRK